MAHSWSPSFYREYVINAHAHAHFNERPGARAPLLEITVESKGGDTRAKIRYKHFRGTSSSRFSDMVHAHLLSNLLETWSVEIPELSV